MMPMATASFSFDLFGLTRRKYPLDPAVFAAEGDAAVGGYSAKAEYEADIRRAEQRDRDYSFWNMFPVL